MASIIRRKERIVSLDIDETHMKRIHTHPSFIHLPSTCLWIVEIFKANEHPNVNSGRKRMRSVFFTHPE